MFPIDPSPPGKLADDHVKFTKLVELLLNIDEFSSNLLQDITGGRLECPPSADINTTTGVQASDLTSLVHEFHNGFRAALRDLRVFHEILRKLHQKLDNSLRSFVDTISKLSLWQSEQEDIGIFNSSSSHYASQFIAKLRDLHKFGMVSL